MVWAMQAEEQDLKCGFDSWKMKAALIRIDLEKQNSKMKWCNHQIFGFQVKDFKTKNWKNSHKIPFYEQSKNRLDQKDKKSSI